MKNLRELLLCLATYEVLQTQDDHGRVGRGREKRLGRQMGKQIIAGRCSTCDHRVCAEPCGIAAGVTNPL